MIIRTIAHVIADRPLRAVAPEASLRKACRVMKRADVGALAVVSERGLVGILCERDIVRRGVSAGWQMDRTRVSDVMTPDPVTVESTASLAAAMEIMVMGGFRHVPVLRGGEPVGLVSMRDIPTQYRLMVERFADAQSGPGTHEGRSAVVV